MLCRTIAIVIAVAAAAASPPWRTRVLGQGAAQDARARSPAIDPLTASIQGRATTADSGAPIRRAEVRAMSNSGINRLATTDGDGRFELRDMPAGQYRVIVTRSGFVPLTFGQRRPLEAGRPIDLRQGQRFTANIALPRAGAIAGRIYDQAGEAVASARVQALRSRVFEGRRRLEPIGPSDRTDDTGAFRLYGLPPGEYYVSASAPRQPAMLPAGAPLLRTVAPPDQSVMTVFHPGTGSLAEALPVRIDAGGDARADIQIGDLPSLVVSGVVFSSAGAPAADATLALRSEIIALGAAVSGVTAGPPPLVITGHANADGTFEIANVPAGPYTLTATLRPDWSAFTITRTTTGEVGFLDPSTGRITPAAIALNEETASMPLVVAGGNLTGLSLTTGSGGVIDGTFVADDGVTQPLPQPLGVSVRSTWRSQSVMMQSGGRHTFRLQGLIGPANVSVDGLPEGWAVKAIVVDGVDVTDEPLDFGGGRQVDARIVLTDRVAVVTGSVVEERPRGGEDRGHHTVVVFPEDAAKWTYPSRYVRAVRSDEQGAFRIAGLPPDHRYLAVAVDFVEDGEWSDPEFLEHIRRDATSFTLSESERRRVDVRLLRR